MATRKQIDPRVLAALAAQKRAPPPEEDTRAIGALQRARIQQALQGRQAPPPSQLPERAGMACGGKVKKYAKGGGVETKGKTRGRYI